MEIFDFCKAVNLEIGEISATYNLSKLTMNTISCWLTTCSKTQDIIEIRVWGQSESIESREEVGAKAKRKQKDQ